MTSIVNFQTQPSASLVGEILVPGDKSISHRTIMLGAIAQGTTHINGFLEAEDTLATLNALRAMGVKIEGPNQGKVIVHGVGLHGLQKPEAPLNLGNSGTSMRLLSGLLAGQKFSSVLMGDASLSKRPMRRVTMPLADMGAIIDLTGAGTAPLHIHGNANLKGIDYVMPVASAQVKSCLILAGLYAQGNTSITEPTPTRDHTERMLEGCAYPLNKQGNKITIKGDHSLQAVALDVPGDLSSAAFFLVGGTIAQNADITLQHVGVNPTRTGIIDILRLMGADIAINNKRLIGGEPVADLRVRSSQLQGIEVPQHLVALAIDEFPALFVAAACAKGQTVVTGAQELRFKESDRIQVMADGLNQLGIDAQATANGMIVKGGNIQGGTVIAHGDHRIAMAFAMAGVNAKNSITIQDCVNVNTSFPSFIKQAQDLGLHIKIAE